MHRERHFFVGVHSALNGGNIRRRYDWWQDKEYLGAALRIEHRPPIQRIASRNQVDFKRR